MQVGVYKLRGRKKGGEKKQRVKMTFEAARYLKGIFITASTEKGTAGVSPEFQANGSQKGVWKRRGSNYVRVIRVLNI